MKILPEGWQFHGQFPVFHAAAGGRGGPYRVYLQKYPLQIMSISYRVYIFDKKFSPVLFGEVTVTQGNEPYKVLWGSPPEIVFSGPSSDPQHPIRTTPIAVVPMSLSRIRQTEAENIEIGNAVREIVSKPNAFDENGQASPEVNAAVQKATEEIRRRMHPSEEKENTPAPGASPLSSPP